MASWIFLLLLIGVIVYMVKNWEKAHLPTWKGIIISALIGLLPLYLVLCFLKVMGKERTDYPQ